MHRELPNGFEYIDPHIALTYGEDLLQSKATKVTCTVLLAAGNPELSIWFQGSRGKNNSVLSQNALLTTVEIHQSNLRWTATGVLYVPVNGSITCRVTDWFGSYIKRKYLPTKGMIDQ